MSQRYWIHSAPDDYTEEGQRECARGERCTDPRLVTEGGKTVRLPALTYRAFCDSDRNAIERALYALQDYQFDVYDELGTKGQTVGPVVSTSKSAPLPINLNADELLRDMHLILISWHERVAAVARLAEPVGVVSSCGVLAAHIDVLLALPKEPMGRSVPLHDAAKLPAGTAGLVHKTAAYADVFLHLDGASAGLEILRLHHRCRRLLGVLPPPARRLNGVYCDCGFAELYELLDDDGQQAGAKCRQCRAEYDRDEYADLTRERVELVKTYRRSSLRSKETDDLISGRA